MKKTDKPLTQPLIMRRDYEDHTEERKESSMMKKIAPIDYDDLEVKKFERDNQCITDYDKPVRCRGNCFLCDR